MKEIWKDIKSYEGLYQVSNLGRVRSLDKLDSWGRKVKGKILKPKKEKKGYLRVTLHKNGIPEYFKVHRLVAVNFINNTHNFPEVNHIDENKENNRVDNLEWCTTRYNCCYGTRIDRMLKTRGQERKKPYIKKGRCKYRNIIQLDKDNNKIRTFNNASDVEDKLKIDRGLLYRCLRGESLTCGGFKWECEVTTS